jgi:hypothetical protein
MFMLLTLGIHEINQKSALDGQRLTFRTLAGGLLDHELWPIYLLVGGGACMNFYSGLGALVTCSTPSSGATPSRRWAST